MRSVLLKLSVVCIAALSIQTFDARADEGESKADALMRGIGGVLGQRRKSKPAPEQPSAQAKEAQKSLEQAQAEDRQKGKLSGAALGGVAGAMIDDEDRARGAALGAVAGGIAGGVVGNVMADKRGDYAQRYNEIDKAISAAEQKNTSLRSQTSRIEQRMALRERQIEVATTRKSANQAVIAATSKELAEIEADINANNSASESAMVSVKMLEDEIAALSSEEGADPGLVERKSKLQVRRDELRATLQRINDVDATLMAQREMLTGHRKG